MEAKDGNRYKSTLALLKLISDFLADQAADANDFSFVLPDYIYDHYDAIAEESQPAADIINAGLPYVMGEICEPNSPELDKKGREALQVEFNWVLTELKKIGIPTE